MSIPIQNNQIVVEQNIVVNGQVSSSNSEVLQRLLLLEAQRKSLRSNMLFLVFAEFV